MSLELLLPAALIILGLFLLWSMRRQRVALRMPAGKTVLSDTSEAPGTILYADNYGLKGRPDFLIRQGRAIIPVEVKTGRTPRRPYQGHIMQLIAYCVLVEANYGVRPEYGIIRYPERDFRIPFTADREQALAEVLYLMCEKQAQTEVHRDHDNSRICAACGYREQCGEQLA